MAVAQTDANGVTTMLAALSTDGVTPINVAVDPTAHGIYIDDNTTGSDLGTNPAKRDANGETILFGVSSADGVTPVAIYANASGYLLVNST